MPTIGSPRPRLTSTTHYMDPKVLVEVSRGLGEPMVGIDIHEMPAHERYAGRGV